MSSIIRSMARDIAGRNMKKQGYVKIHKYGFFSNNWKKYAPRGGRK